MFSGPYLEKSRHKYAPGVWYQFLLVIYTYVLSHIRTNTLGVLQNGTFSHEKVTDCRPTFASGDLILFSHQLAAWLTTAFNFSSGCRDYTLRVKKKWFY